MEMIPSYVARANGLEHVVYLTPELKPILEDTYGVLVYQEQTMRIARDLAGYSEGQADGFRKAIGKKDAEKMEKELKKFLHGDSNEGIPGLVKMGMPEETAIQLAELIKRFASYGLRNITAIC